MIVVEVVFLAVFWGWVVGAILFLRQIVLPRNPRSASQEARGLPAETVHIRSTDGLRLEGWKIPSSNPSQPWIVLCHGLGSNRSDLLDIASVLHETDFNLLLVDFRGHGGSGGWTTSFGWYEQRDLEGALAFLGQQPDVPAKPYGIYGMSMGAAVALMVAARDERLGAVAADSPYHTLQEALSHHMKRAYPALPRIPFLWFIQATYRVRFGVWPRHVAPHRQVGSLSPRPLLLIQGTEVARTPSRWAQQLLAAAGEPKELWVAEREDDLGAHQHDPRPYPKRLARFFLTHLGEGKRAGADYALKGERSG